MSSAEEKRHLRRVADLGCCVCGSPAIPHHIRSGASSGMGLKATDYETIPLCNLHHTDGGFGVAIHAGIKTWQKRFGTEAELLALTMAELGI